MPRQPARSQGNSPNAPTSSVVPPITLEPIVPSLHGHGYCVTMNYATLHGADGLRVPQFRETVPANRMRRRPAMHSRIMAIVGAVAIALFGSAGAMAQDATPEVTPGGESLFADLG